MYGIYSLYSVYNLYSVYSMYSDRSSVMLVLPPLKSETGWTGELWSNHVLIILEN